MAEELFRDLFRRRNRLIQAGDAAVSDAERVFSLAQAGQRQQHVAAAAELCEQAAAAYLKAGLGLLAKEQFATASRFYSLCGDHERTRLNQERWAAVSTYWEEAGST